MQQSVESQSGQSPRRDRLPRAMHDAAPACVTAAGCLLPRSCLRRCWLRLTTQCRPVRDMRTAGQMGDDGAPEEPPIGGFPGSGLLYAAVRHVSGLFQSFLTSSLNWEEFLEALNTPEQVLSDCLPACLPACLPVSDSLSLSLPLSVRPSMHPSIHLRVCDVLGACCS